MGNDILKRAILLALAVLAMGSLLGARSKAVEKTVRIGGITWYTDIDVATELARRENKPLWVHFGENPG